MDDSLTDALRKLLQGCCGQAQVRAIEAGAAPTGLWAQIEASGFANALLAESQGGAGLSLGAAFALLELCGAQALPVPLGETMLARALLAAAGLAPPAGSIALAPAALRADGGLHCACVALGRVADHVLLAVAGSAGAVVAAGDMGNADTGSAPAGAAGDVFLLSAVDAIRAPHVFVLDAAMTWPASAVAAAQRVAGCHDLLALQACVSAAQLSGALMAVCARTMDYANQRQQFGRAIGKFQAIQHQLALMSEHVVAARMAARMACNAPTYRPVRLRVAVAKARSSQAALEVAALAHSIHGAIGFTEEYALQLYTRRLHAWRQSAGSESFWQQLLGEHLMAPGTLALDAMRAATDMDSSTPVNDNDNGE